MQANRPSENFHTWNRFSGNEPVIKYCLDAIATYDGSIAKAICVNAPVASGGSVLLSQIANRAIRHGRRVLYLDDNLHLGNRYLVSKIMRSMGVGTVNVEGSNGLTVLCAEVMRLRRYDMVIIDDAHKYIRAAKRVAESNAKAILQITCLPKPPLIIMAGSADEMEFYYAQFIDAGISTEVKLLPAMQFGEGYIRFVENFCEANNYLWEHFGALDLETLHRQSEGRIGLTVRNLDWLHLNMLAGHASRHVLYMQDGQVDAYDDQF